MMKKIIGYTILILMSIPGLFLTLIMSLMFLPICIFQLLYKIGRHLVKDDYLDLKLELNEMYELCFEPLIEIWK